MGFGKKRNKLRLEVLNWGCEGQLGFGQGKALEKYGKEYLHGRSVCNDICPKNESCRQKHYNRMDEKFPALASLVKSAAREAYEARQPIIPTVIAMMKAAVKDGNPEALQIVEGLKEFRVEEIVDHYVYGQLVNINNGIKGKLDV